MMALRIILLVALMLAPTAFLVAVWPEQPAGRDPQPISETRPAGPARCAHLRPELTEADWNPETEQYEHEKFAALFECLGVGQK